MASAYDSTHHHRGDSLTAGVNASKRNNGETFYVLRISCENIERNFFLDEYADLVNLADQIAAAVAAANPAPTLDDAVDLTYRPTAHELVAE